MSRFLLSAVAGALTLALSGTAQAGHGHSSSHSYSGGSSYSKYNGGTFHTSNYSKFNAGTTRSFSTTNSYHLKYGTKFSYGYYFSGRNNHFWSSYSFSRRYGCYCYWYPALSCWYYWYAPGNCYYPISYITVAPPVAVAGPVASVPPPAGPAGPPTP
jgi:hypothetical protein